MTKEITCENCGAIIKYDHDLECYVCKLCGYTSKDKSNSHNPEYVG